MIFSVRLRGIANNFSLWLVHQKEVRYVFPCGEDAASAQLADGYNHDFNIALRKVLRI